MTVSVIMPAYNCQNLVGQAITSILEQSYQDLELLIADDASTDFTRSVIDSFKDTRIRHFHNDKNLGYLGTVNRLLEKATGEYICFQDADDWSALDRIEKQLSLVLEGSVDACGTGIYYTDSKGKPSKYLRYPTSTAEVRQSMLQGRPSACYASILFSKVILDTVGVYRDFFTSGAEDVDWLLRLVEKHEFANLEAPLYFYRFSPSSITQSTSMLKQKASLQVARDMALQRQAGLDDFLQAGNVAALNDRWNEIVVKLGEYPLAEDLHKINSLIRRGAIWECGKVCIGVATKKAPFKNKIEVISSAVLKMILGMNRYQVVKSALNRSVANGHDR